MNENVQDQNYTIAKFVGEPKVYGDKTRFAFTTNEEGEKIVSLFTKFPENIKPGAEIYGHIEEQEKDGRTYLNFFFGKNNPNRKGGMSEGDKAQVVKAQRDATAALQAVNILRTELIDAGVLEETTSNGDPMPDFDPELKSLEATAH